MESGGEGEGGEWRSAEEVWASLLKGEDEKWKVRKECHSGYGRFYLMETRRRRKRATGRRYDDSRGRMWNVEGREVMIVRERI